MAIKKLSIESKEIKGLIFDLNGTLVERMSNHPVHLEFLEKYLSEKIEGTPVLKGKSTREICKTNNISFEEYCSYRDFTFDFTRVFSFNDELFRLIKDFSGKYKLAIYTNATQKMAEVALEISNISRYFDLVLSCDHGFAKPSSQGFTYVCSQLNENYSNMLMIGNNFKKDILPFDALGGNTVFVENEKDIFHLPQLLPS